MQLHTPEINAALPETGSNAAASLPSGPNWRRRVLWILGIAAVLALLILTPPLVNANRYRGKIAESMSKSLGRPVHLDNVSLHLLPVPGFTLENLVVSEDPAFGAEPTIRANTVEATLRVSSLWHRPVEFSTVRFVEPSVNLVRNAQGRWNLSDVLLNASHVESAPTSQRKAGPKPRFPYIEATGGRVNVKLGPEKLPFSFTDADFALWLPSPQQWRVRLIGQPGRTDTNITDPGRLRIEGELRRASTIGQVPVTLQATWHDAPLGEATRILTGDDWGWRGTANVDATLAGTLGDAHLATKLTLGGLRRGEFFPAHPLDVQVTCAAGFMLHPATLSHLMCSLPDDAPTPLTLQAETIPLQNPKATAATVQGTSIPVRWTLLWAALFSPRVPGDVLTSGTVDLNLERNRHAQPAIDSPRKVTRKVPSLGDATPSLQERAGWTGTVQVHFPAPGQPGTATASSKGPEGEGENSGATLTWSVTPAAVARDWPSLHLAPTPVPLGEEQSILLSAEVGGSGYTFNLSGSAPVAAVLGPTRYLPPLGDDASSALPSEKTGSMEPEKLRLTCTRQWGQPQACTSQPGASQ